MTSSRSTSTSTQNFLTPRYSDTVGVRSRISDIARWPRAREAWPNLPNRKLVHLADYFGLENSVAHRALNDTLWALEVYFRDARAHPTTSPSPATKALSTGSPSVIPVTTGPRQSRIEVLGTKRYQQSFEAMCGPRTNKGAALHIHVKLRVETKLSAVCVLIRDEVIENLVPRIAQDFRLAIIEGHLGELTHFECSVEIRGRGFAALQMKGITPCGSIVLRMMINRRPTNISKVTSSAHQWGQIPS